MEEIENVRVVVRVRPLNPIEKNLGYTTTTTIDRDCQTINVKKPGDQHKDDPPKTFKFDHVFDIDSSQMNVYCYTACPVVEKVLEGYNGTIFAYGQTGTGKTYTMSGQLSSAEVKGVIPNTFAHIFGNIAKAGDEVAFLVRVTYLEIYNEEVRDLLSKENNLNLEVRERPDIGVFVQDLSGYVVNSCEDMERIMSIGDKNRAIGSTLMNEQSSRSHAVFTITIESSRLVDEKQHLRVGKLHLVDLAGSERQSKTNNCGVRLREASKINQSLSVLGNVISALVDGKSTHIPYRNSKLTRLLQDSLGGNSKTVMIATVSPSENDYDETVSTLRYANRAKNIQNKTHINQEPKDAMIIQFQEEIAELKRQLDTFDLPMSPPDSYDSQKKSRKSKRPKRPLDSSFTSNSTDGLEEIPMTGEELHRAKSEKTKLREKLMNLENKIIVGGENLLERALNTEAMLEVVSKELEEQKQNDAELEQSLQKIEAERIDIEERYSNLHEEALGKSKKLKKVMQMLAQCKAEYADQLRDQQREMEAINDSIRALTREQQLAELLLNSYIPKEYQAMIDRYAHWNEDIGEWQLKCVAYTGNNMRKQQIEATKYQFGAAYRVPIGTHQAYLEYNDFEEGPAPKTQASEVRGETPKARASSVPRPMTRRGRDRP